MILFDMNLKTFQRSPGVQDYLLIVVVVFFHALKGHLFNTEYVFPYYGKTSLDIYWMKIFHKHCAFIDWFLIMSALVLYRVSDFVIFPDSEAMVRE